MKMGNMQQQRTHKKYQDNDIQSAGINMVRMVSFSDNKLFELSILPRQNSVVYGVYEQFVNQRIGTARIH